MNSHICKCCGQPVAETKDGLPRNPNICIKCSEAEDARIEAGSTEAVSEETAEAEESDGGVSAFAM